MKFKRGFTLVEVVVVIGIIAILTVIIFPSISNIRAKNRDTERISDIAAIQLGLSLFYNHNGQYATTTLDQLVPKYFPLDAIVPPNNDVDYKYIYVPLMRNGTKCTYYHLGTKLELPSGQIDPADTFSSLDKNNVSNDYSYCNGYLGPGIENSTTTLTYAVHP